MRLTRRSSRSSRSAPIGSPLVTIDEDGPAVPARLVVRATLDRVLAAIASGQQAVVLFERGDRGRPLIIGFIEPLALAPDSPAAVSPSGGESPVAGVPEQGESSVLACIEADVDGRRVTVTAQDEIVLQCGSASVTLRRNGRVVIRGAYVETHSEGTNRIKGGQVQIN